VDFEAEIAVITDDVPLSTSAEAAKGHIRLLMLANDISLRELVAGETSKGFGFFQSKPATAFSPVAVTPDELGAAWDGQKLHLPLLSTYNNKLFGRPNAGVDMAFDFPTLIAHATKTRSLGAGTVVGAGMVSNRQEIGTGASVSGGGLGYSCLAELRTVETLDLGTPKTAFMRFGDQIRIEMLDSAGGSIFGAIDQRLRQFVPEN
ncbi:MAG: fumarylacetoacetate hydrolase family protein, partial [Alphaproteobacteria bacterium]